MVKLSILSVFIFFFFFQAEDGIRDLTVTGVQTCALPICWADGGATGINVFAQAFAPEASAIVVDNDVTMSAPEGMVFGASSAGIQIKIGRASCRERV